MLRARLQMSTMVCLSNVHMLMEAKGDQEFNQIFRNADLRLLDGMPLVWSFQFFHGKRPERIAGKHLMLALLEKASIQKISVFFYGSTPEKLTIAMSYLERHFPYLKIAGHYSPPFRALTAEEYQQHAELIQESGASIVFVALGCPKQERWMHTMKGRIPAVMLGIGIALEVLTGQQKSTPIWIENAGLEWLFRLYKEPRRLAKRYFVTNLQFMGLFLKTVLSGNT
jgi:N-acetylglucosaminyldiphosphoundecaprenol N-acetyl-beta-D-mannosaminyltransferase